MNVKAIRSEVVYEITDLTQEELDYLTTVCGQSTDMTELGFVPNLGYSLYNMFSNAGGEDKT